jgi:hypothetical protein
MSAVDDLLRAADPSPLVDARWTDAVLVEAKKEIESGRRRRHRFFRVMPFVLVGAVALTGGTIAVVAALGQLGVNGNSVEYDVTVPLQYTDVAGLSHTCEYGFYVGDGETKSPQATDIVNHLKQLNWDGAGQRVYNYAEERRADGIEGPREYQHQAAFSRALTEVLYKEIPTDLLSGKDVVAGASTCDGEGLSW